MYESDLSYSAIIPVYNRPGFVKNAIESVFQQSFQPKEIIVVDDASDIALEPTLRPYFSRIQLITHDKNLGVSAARNTGANAASGKYIAFLDSDDLWLANKAVKQLEFMAQGNYLFSHTDEFWLRGDKWINQGKQHAKYGGDIFCKLLDKCRTSPSSMIFERSFFRNIGGFDETLRVCEDYELALRASSLQPAGYFDRKLIIKRAVADNSLSASIRYIESVRLYILENLIKVLPLSTGQNECLEEELKRKRNIVKIK